MLKERIIVVDDNNDERELLAEILSTEGYNVIPLNDGEKALQKLKELPVNIVITDLKMPGLDGLQLLSIIKESYPNVDVILVSGYGTIGDAVEAMKYGAFEYVTKPIRINELKIIVKKVMEQQMLKEENRMLRKKLEGKDGVCNMIIGRESKMQEIYHLIETVADSNTNILIRGESGTGKRVVAQTIHYNSYRKDRPFVEVSCGALPETILESELFGHVRGAFTGAIRDKVGRFELANGGTIFLDEIDAFSPNLQVKLLHVIQDKEFERVGDSKTLKVDVRIVAATNRDLDEEIAKRRFREDLYYRLNVVSMTLPPLRDRIGDIPLLVEHFLDKYSRQANKEVMGIQEEATKMLIRYNWPGNVRELENVIERAVVLAKSNSITAEDLPKSFHSARDRRNKPQVKGGRRNLRESLEEPEREIISNVLKRTNWNRKRAAEILGINRTTLYNKMRKYGLSPEGENEVEEDD
ncbi:MAG: sigma-54 dependent transcriptional regulator [bacterium]|nr:sigma-54 dependent transcriptional regulator [bacterium]